LAALTANMRRVVRRRLAQDPEKRKRSIGVFSVLPVVIVVGYMTALFLETVWPAVGVAAAWVVALLINHRLIYGDRSLVAGYLYDEARGRWEEFNKRVGTKPEGVRLKDISDGIAKVAGRMKEVGGCPAGLRSAVDEVYECGVRLAGEWLRQDKVYEFYERARDINSQPLKDKARRLIDDLIDRTNGFTGLLERLDDTVNRVQVFELSSEMPGELGDSVENSAPDFAQLDALVGDLREWGTCLNRAQEELDREAL
jgi:hypothetical protein